MTDDRSVYRERDLAQVVPQGRRALVVGLSARRARPRARRPRTTRRRRRVAHRRACPARPTPRRSTPGSRSTPTTRSRCSTAWVELGQGTPTAVRQIAAEELGLAIEQVTAAQRRHERLDHRVRTVGCSSTRAAMGATSMRGAAAAARTRCSSSPSAQLGVPVSSLSVDKGVVSGGGKTVKYADLMAGKLFNSTIAAQRAPTLTDPSKLQGDRHARPAHRHPGDRHRPAHLRPERPRAGDAPRPRRPPARPGAPSARARSVLSVDKRSIKHIDGRRRSCGSATSSASSRRRSTTRSRRRRSSRSSGTRRRSCPGNGNLAAALRDPANLAERRDRGATSGDVGAGLAGAAKVVSAELLHAPTRRTCRSARTARSPTSRGDQAHGALHGAGPVHDARRVAGALEAAGRRRSASRSTRARAPTATAPTTTSAISAALLSQAVGKPVRVQFMRWDEHGWDQFGPAQVTDVRAGIDANGKIVALRLHLLAARLDAGRRVGRAARRRHRDPRDGAGRQRRHDQRRLVLQRSRTAASRASGSTATTASSRASGSGPRPRRSRCSPPSRRSTRSPTTAGHRPDRVPHPEHRRDRRRTATPAGSACSTPSRRPRTGSRRSRPRSSTSGNVVKGRGVAIGGFANAFPAIVADITVNKKTGKITVDHLYAAQDAGITVNPASVENQMIGLPRPGRAAAR